MYEKLFNETNLANEIKEIKVKRGDFVSFKKFGSTDCHLS